MTATSRIYFDVTFSSSLSANVGVTRTVRRLFAEIEALAPQNGFACVPVVFNSKGFRELPRELVGSGAETWQNRWPRQSTASARMRLVPRLLFTMSSPWLQRLSWLLLCGWGFNRRSRDLREIEPRLGDILFLSDASWTYPVWRAAILGAKAGAKVVTVVYDLIPLQHPEYSTPLNTMALRRWLKRQLPIADAVMCISRAVKEDLERYARDNRIRLGVTRTFRLGCDHRPGSAEPLARQAIVDFVTGGPCFSAIGSIEMRKNHSLLLLSFDRLWSRGVDVRLLVIGGCDPQNRQLLEHMQSHPQFGKRLLVIVNGDDAEVAFAYRSSRALLLPSSAEGFGLPLVEARAHGCRVIASDLAVFEELADDGVSTFPLQQPEMLDELILNHLALTTPPSPVTPFTWKDSALECMTAFLELTPARRGTN